MDKEKFLYWLDTEFVFAPYGAVSSKIKEIYNEVKSGKFDTKEKIDGEE